MGYYKGTKYYTGILPITTRMYLFGQQYECSVYRTKEGYFIVDTSSLPIGKYIIEDGSIGWPGKYLINFTNASSQNTGSYDGHKGELNDGGSEVVGGKQGSGNSSGVMQIIGQYCRIDDPGANVRSGPGTEYEKIGTAPNNGYYQIVDYNRVNTKKDWYQIDLDGLYCWIYSDLVDLNGNLDGTQDGVPMRIINGNSGGTTGGSANSGSKWPIGQWCYVPDDGNNIRSGAGTDYSIVGVANEGDTFVIVDVREGSTGKDWYKIQLANGKYGWISSGIVEIR